MSEPTNEQLYSACISMRHDYGLMTQEQRRVIEATALEWYRCWKSAGVIQ